MPIIKFNIKKKKIKNTYAEMNIFASNIIKSNVYFHIRGDSSKNFIKKSYKVKTLSNNINIDFLRNSSSFILNSLYYDNSLMREKIGFDLAKKVLGEKYVSKLEYVELFIGNEYVGVYALQEPVETYLDCNRSDLLIQVKTYAKNIKNPKLYDNNYIFDGKNIDEFEIKYNHMLKSDVINLLKKFKTKKFKISNNILKYDLNNNVNYSIFLNLVYAADNYYKNEVILFKKKSKKYVIYKIPWDLDRSQRNENIFSYVKMDEIIMDSALPKIIRESEGFIKLSKERYFKLRDEIYNEENLNTIIDTYYNYLIINGAAYRNNKVWNNVIFNDCINNLKDFYKERITVLDEYYGGL